MINPVWLNLPAKRSTWLIAMVTTLILLGIVFSQLSWQTIVGIWAEISWKFVIIAMLLFLLEGVCTSYRFYVLTPGIIKLSSCFRLTAWYVVMLVLLPARLGELVAVYLLKENLSQKTSPAIMNILVQRLYDIIVLVSLFSIATIFVSKIISPLSILPLVLFILFCLVIVVVKMESLLGMIATSLLKFNKTRYKSILRGVLRARTWTRHSLTQKNALLAFCLTIAKWIFNLAGFSILLTAVINVPEFFDGLFIGALYNFLSMVPLQTIGGFGIGEAGITGILILYGFPSNLAAGTSVFCRLVIISVPCLFWMLVWFVTKPALKT